MIPTFGRIFGEPVPAYFALLTFGFVLATFLLARWAQRNGLDREVMIDLGLISVLAGVAGARVLHVVADGYFWDYVHLCTDPSLVDWPLEKAECLSESYGGVWDAAKSVCHPKATDCFAWAKFWAGGLTYYGGFLGATAAAVWLLRRDRFPFWKAADMAGFAIPIGLAFGRMGCLLAGCCFGAPTTLPWGMSFPPRSPASEEQAKTHLIQSIRMWSEPVHPTQIYESAASLLVALICMYVVLPRKRYDGQVFAASLVLYAVARFLVEILRRDARGGAVGLSTSQLIGLGLIAFAFVIHRMKTRAGANTSAAPTSPSA
jgi:phosphatidylglycerol:prolipoprotein diacylglycerol transferase